MKPKEAYSFRARYLIGKGMKYAKKARESDGDVEIRNLKLAIEEIKLRLSTMEDKLAEAERELMGGGQ